MRQTGRRGPRKEGDYGGRLHTVCLVEPGSSKEGCSCSCYAWVAFEQEAIDELDGRVG